MTGVRPDHTARLAYYFSTFPALTTTFMNHQVAATERMGLNTLLVANRPPDHGMYHPQDHGAYRRTVYLRSQGISAYLRSAWKYFLKHPRRMLATVGMALTLPDGFPLQRWRRLLHIAGATHLSPLLGDCGAAGLHIHFAYGAASVALFLKKLTGFPYSLSIHGGDALLPQPLIEEKLVGAQFIVSNCRYHISNLRRRFPRLKHQRFYVVNGGVDLTSGPFASPAPLNQGRTLKLVCVGRLVWEKAHTVLIRGIADLKARGVSVTCRLVGDGPERSNLEALISQLGLTDDVHLLGAMPQSKVAAQYRWADLLVLPSVSEGTPMVIIEAMSMGRPVIASRITAIPEMLVEGECGVMVAPNSPLELVHAIAGLAGRPNKIAAMGAAARKRVETHFDLKVNARKLMAIFAHEYPWLAVSGARREAPHPI